MGSCEIVRVRSVRRRGRGGGGRTYSGVSARLGTAGRVGSRTCGFVWDRASGARTAVLNTQRRRCVGSRVTCCVVISLVLLLIGQLGVRMSGFLTFTFQLSLPFSPCVGLSLRWGMGAGREAISSGGRVLCGARAQCQPGNNGWLRRPLRIPTPQLFRKSPLPRLTFLC